MVYYGILKDSICNKPEYIARKDYIIFLTLKKDTEKYVDNDNDEYTEDMFEYFTSIEDRETAVLKTVGGYGICVYYENEWKEIFSNKTVKTTKMLYEHETCSYLKTHKILLKQHKCCMCGQKEYGFNGVYKTTDNILRIVEGHIFIDRYASPNRFICYNCLTEKWGFCFGCKELTEITYLCEYKNVFVNGKRDNIKLCHVCQRLISKCDFCGECFYDITMTFIDTKCSCPSCTANDTNICVKCCREIPKEELNYYFDKKYCDVCLTGIKLNKQVQAYNFKFNNQLFGKKKELLFGFEFETEIKANNIQREDMARYVCDILNKENDRYKQYVYVKHDGSLTNGIEIVTNPMSYDFIIQNMNIFDMLFSLKEKYLYAYETNTCGFHIHMSKDSFATLHMYKFLDFMYNKENREFIKRISERSKFNDWTDKYCFFPDSKGYVIKDLIKKQSRTKTNCDVDRHSLISITDKTIEVRVFRGLLEKERFLKNLQFVLSMYTFTKDESRNRINLSNYMEYINKTNKYRTLKKFISTMGG